MMKGTYRLALLMGLIAFGAASAEAAELAGPEDAPARAVRVINNYVTPVNVYVQDAEGRLHRLGGVARGQAKLLEISDEIAPLGDYRIKVFPNEPVWSSIGDDFGVRTRDISLDEGDVLNFWVEPELTNSLLELTGG